MLILWKLLGKFKKQLESLSEQLLPWQAPGERISDNEGRFLAPCQGADLSFPGTNAA